MLYVALLTMVAGPAVALAFVLWVYRFARRLKLGLTIASPSELDRLVDMATFRAAEAQIAILLVRLLLIPWRERASSVESELSYFSVLAAICLFYSFALKKDLRRRTHTHLPLLGERLRCLFTGSLAAFILLFLVWYSLKYSIVLLRPLKTSNSVRINLFLGFYIALYATWCFAIYLFSPVLARFDFRARAPSAILERRLREAWSKTRATAINFWLIDSKVFRAMKICVIGSRWGWGTFRPGLFIHSDLIGQLNESELEALIVRESIHYVRHDSSKQFWLAIVLYFPILVLSAELFGFSLSFSTLYGIGAWVLPIYVLSRFVFQQEIETDMHAVGMVGVAQETLTSALSKLGSSRFLYLDPKSLADRARLVKTRLDSSRTNHSIFARHFLKDLFSSTRGFVFGSVLLIEMLAFVTFAYSSYSTAQLGVAIHRGSIAKVSQLLASGIDPNRPDLTGTSTPLMWAAKYGRPEIMKLLLDHGARLDATDSHGDPISLAEIAAEAGHVEVLRLLHNKGVALNKLNETGQTLLHGAAFYGRLQVVKYLVSIGLRIDKRDKYGDSALMLAAWQGRLAVVRYLHGLGSDINQTNAYHMTPLWMASSYGQKEVARYLIDEGARLDDLSKSGESALETAHIYGHDDVETLLVTAGAEMRPHRPYRSIASTVLR